MKLVIIRNYLTLFCSIMGFLVSLKRFASRNPIRWKMGLSYNEHSSKSDLKPSQMAKFVRERVVLSSLVSRYADLTAVNQHSYKTSCLFHKDNNPSMMINDIPISSPYYYCFSCGENGDFTKLLSHKANISSSSIVYDSYKALSSGKSVDEWIESFEQRYGITMSQHALIPRASLVSRKSSKKSIDRSKNNEIIANVEDEWVNFDDGIVKDSLNQAKRFYSTRLLMDPNAYFVRAYLKDRGISTETAMKFELGYAPTARLLNRKAASSASSSLLRNASLNKTLSGKPSTSPPAVSFNTVSASPIANVSNSILKQSVGETFKQWTTMQGMTLTDWMLCDLAEGSEEQNRKLQYMVHAGLTVNTTKYMEESQDNNQIGNSLPKLNRRQTHYDRFRNRLMIPIRNQAGEVIGFGGRELPLPRNLMTDEELQQLDQEIKLKKPVAKYINSPSSRVFTKKKVLFGLDTAAPHCEKDGYVIMVEGYFDVISCYQAGVKNVVAAMGTSVTLEQLLAAAELTSSRAIILLLDNDEAGQKAAQRAKRIVDKHHEQVRRLLRPDGDTIDEEEIQQKHFITLKRAFIDDALPFITKHEIRTIAGGIYSDNQKKLKDCADICELFPATNARRIIRHIAREAIAVESEVDTLSKDSNVSDSSYELDTVRPLSIQKSPKVKWVAKKNRTENWNPSLESNVVSSNEVASSDNFSGSPPIAKESKVWKKTEVVDSSFSFTPSPAKRNLSYDDVV